MFEARIYMQCSCIKFARGFDPGGKWDSQFDAAGARWLRSASFKEYTLPAPGPCNARWPLSPQNLRRASIQ